MESAYGRNLPVLGTVFVALVSLLAIYIAKIIKYRYDYRKLHGALKSPPFSMWFGTILGIAGIYQSSPIDTHPMCTMTLLSRKFNLGALYFLDNWPAAKMRQLVINDPDVAAQAVQQKGDLAKYHEYPDLIGHIVGRTSMLITTGEEWKKTRALFNPGFAVGHLMTLVPGIVDDTLVYVKMLGKLADSGEVKPIEDLLARLTYDIMGHVVLDHDLNAQTTENEMVNGFNGSVTWTPSPMTTNPLKYLYKPVYKAMQWYYTRLTDAYIQKIIQQRLESRDLEDGGPVKKLAKRPGIDLAIDEYLGQGRKIGVADAHFMQIAIDQMKTFLFAGSDTSSSTMCFIYHMLNLHPEALEKVRKEHDDVFGPSAGSAEAIKRKPALLNELPFTLAVIKEALRLFPPASTAREGSPSVSLTYNGTTYPTANSMVWINTHTMQRRADLYPDPDSFIPERFLPAPDNWPAQKEIVRDSWRPFEKGPRACIGQELALVETKVNMVLTCREFDVEAAYAVWDRKMGREKPGETLGGKRGLFGSRAYQQMKATAKPADGMPARVRKRQVV
ncbi:cytochrome P450 71B25 [Drepanopeziza brunnea f. sp. 'multigermtubi' MB_m1]|uniref:Cytochrome P450 71B25 n=1 Tax=Marssonina brunnea f. sp. multigermtubi (strain MB_m1) TaxID=1072389 RepID=K1WVT5_MARBU|nr:cytochrome P450 71B25 [Drepanopeziza brunnea f. sp. 'multigermtubi' MB_m1]EKD21755.1 cytochrome P450 71B25 [Drepanopeziza brunnea f. sp. 'multigermtubi' MB_m1]